MQKVEPFVLSNKLRLPAEDHPKPWQVFDPGLQLWVDGVSGTPLVAVRREQREGCPSASAEGGGSRISASAFGETSMTKTREGADQAEVSSDTAESDFGGWIAAETREGRGGIEVLSHSSFGETSITETREGADQTDSAQNGEFAEW